MLAGPVLANDGVLVLTPTGQVVVASVGTGVSLVANGGGYTIQTATPNAAVGSKPTRQADGTYLWPQAATAASLVVYRNGVRQSAAKIGPVAAIDNNATRESSHRISRRLPVRHSLMADDHARSLPGTPRLPLCRTPEKT